MVAHYLVIVLLVRWLQGVASVCDGDGVGGISGAEGEWIGC